jgi:hypothetical protein
MVLWFLQTPTLPITGPKTVPRAVTRPMSSRTISVITVRLLYLYSLFSKAKKRRNQAPGKYIEVAISKTDSVNTTALLLVQDDVLTGYKFIAVSRS